MVSMAKEKVKDNQMHPELWRREKEETEKKR